MNSKTQSRTRIVWATQSHDRIGDRVYDVLVRESRRADVVKSSYHAAAIVYRNQILSVGLNRRKTHPVMAKYQKNEKRIFLHAEVDALIRFVNRYGMELLPDCSLYVLRTTKTGRVADSKPCSGCMSMIQAFRVGNVYWTSKKEETSNEKVSSCQNHVCG